MCMHMYVCKYTVHLKVQDFGSALWFKCAYKSSCIVMYWISGGAQEEEQSPINRKVGGSTPTPKRPWARR